MIDSELIVLQKQFFYERFPAERGSEKLALFEANLENYYLREWQNTSTRDAWYQTKHLPEIYLTIFQLFYNTNNVFNFPCYFPPFNSPSCFAVLQLNHCFCSCLVSQETAGIQVHHLPHFQLVSPTFFHS